jgi:glutathione S-transferase
MRVYHSPRTRSSRVLWALEELGLPYDLTTLTVDERRGDKHRERHPLGRVPVIELDDGTVMFESAAICLYLADRNPQADLVPPPLASNRPLAYQWMFYAMTELEPAVIAWRRADRDGTDTTEPLTRLQETARAIDDALTDRTWLLGDYFTVIDIVATKIWQPLIDTTFSEEFPSLTNYAREALERPAYTRAEAIDHERV